MGKGTGFLFSITFTRLLMFSYLFSFNFFLFSDICHGDMCHLSMSLSWLAYRYQPPPQAYNDNNDNHHNHNGDGDGDGDCDDEGWDKGVADASRVPGRCFLFF
jgi:hypothetical protein